MVKILDTTLREGELHPGVYFNGESRTQIAEALAEVEAARIEFPLAYPQRGGKIEDIKAAITTIQENYGNTAVIQFRACKQDIELAQEYDAKGCALYLAPTSIHRMGKFHGMTKEKVIELFVETLELAKSYGFTYRRAVLEDASRFNSSEEKTTEDCYGFLENLLKAVKDAGATIVSIPDTSGIMPPSFVTSFIETIGKLTDQPLACHFHNDYGNALSNALQATTITQVEEIHVSILGLGARNGITDHYEFVANLEDLLHIRSGERREKLCGLYKVFCETTGIPIPWTHPLALQCFAEKAGTHQSQVLKDASGYMPRKKLENDSYAYVYFEAGQLMSKRVVEKIFQTAASDLPYDFSLTPALAQEITEAMAARSALKQREVSLWEASDIIKMKAGVEIPIEKLQRVIREGDYAYITLKLLPQFQVGELIREVGKWKEVERIDEVYGDCDLIIFARLKDARGVYVTDKIQKRFKHSILKAVTLPTE